MPNPRPMPLVGFPLLPLFLLLACPLVAAAQPPRFAPMPMQDRETLVRQFAPLLIHLEGPAGEPAEFAFFDSNAEIIAAFAAREVDIAQLGPLPYVQLRARYAAAEPLVRFREADGGSLYRCALVVFAGDRPRLADLRDRPIGLTQRLSTCGYLSVNAMLRAQTDFGLQQTRYRYLGGHDAVARAVLGGEVAAGGLKESLARGYAEVGLEIVATTDPLPGFALIANRATLPDATLNALRQRLLALPEPVWRDWGEPIRHGMDAAADTDYDRVRAMGTDIPPEPPARP